MVNRLMIHTNQTRHPCK